METPPTITPLSSITEGTMDDIQYLLHLEAMRRFQEDSRNVKRQVEEQLHIWLDAKCEYQLEFGRLTRVLKCGALQAVVDAHHVSDVKQIEQAGKDIASLRSKLRSDLRPAILDSNDVEHGLDQLNTTHKSRQNLCRQQREFAQNQEALSSLRVAVDGLENGMEMGMAQSIDRLVEDLLPPREKNK